jgi:hypothetical protein
MTPLTLDEGGVFILHCHLLPCVGIPYKKREHGEAG